MNVYLLIEEREQPNFVDNYGEEAVSTSTVLGVYQDAERANNEQKRLTEESLKAEQEEGTDPIYYYVEERPIL